MAKKNPYRFSTKAIDNNSGLVYYGYRYYAPSVGRWVNRDPLIERGFRRSLNMKLRTLINTKDVYSFVRGDAINSFDILGLDKRGTPRPGTDCDDPCGWAERNRDPGARGQIVCCNGVKYHCVFKSEINDKVVNSIARDIVADCTAAHEKKHLPDPNIKCKPRCGWTGPIAAEFENATTRGRGEFEAWTESLNCLSDGLSRCAGDPNCEAEIAREIATAADRIEDFRGY